MSLRSRVATADIVICGAGIAGISAAYHLAVRHGIHDVVLVDERPPLSLTSDKSVECYRNWWPGPGDQMVRFMNRSIDLLEELACESGNFFSMDRRGYFYLTADSAGSDNFLRSARVSSELGAGPLRIHRGRLDDPVYTEPRFEGFKDQPSGADLFLDRDLILARYPFLAEDVVAALNPRRCGWLAGQQLGMYLLDACQDRGVRVLRARVNDIVVRQNRVEEVVLSGKGANHRIATHKFVNASGPFIHEMSKKLGVDLEDVGGAGLFHELHWKVIFTDHLGVVPRQLPIMIWADPVTLDWTEEERFELERDSEMRRFLNKLPAGVVFRPEGGPGSQSFLIHWTYDLSEHPLEVPLPPPEEIYPALALRALAKMIPGISVYYEKAHQPFVDGGYYCKTKENRPLIGPLPVEGSFLIGALSGFGIMASQAAGELLAAHLTGSQLPAYASAFSLERYEDPAYKKQLHGDQQRQKRGTTSRELALSGQL